MYFAEAIVPIFIVGMLFIGLPWLVLHYVTRWRTAATLTGEDEAMLDQMFETARRLEDRLSTIERIIAADHPDFRSGLTGGAPYPPLAPTDPDFGRPESQRRN
ncbi:envelope stress response membrane protein PspB [Sphingobium sufflavum]|uniref:envelope stress response membrane protein PspB n=1 Tax=Sphingobium sufflavum TaxID=1129547 RepID=UPI001F2EA8F7|nr:envelope stress response membrane protein PspB [Sphingobium sufflavum]MCE7798234.1 envelope stress response membrane protein PspB [Sphingobium sufflavum]